VTDIDPNTPENQEKRRAWADQHIYACVSSLVNHLLEQGDDYQNEDWFVDLFVVIDEDGEYGDYREALCFYAVSDRLAWLLKERGEAVACDMYGLNVWGRTTYGQLCYIDSVMEDSWLYEISLSQSAPSPPSGDP